MHFLRRAWLINASAFLLFAVATQAIAQFEPIVTVKTASGLPSGPASIQINDRTAVQFLTPNGPLSPAQRAQLAASRLQALVDMGADLHKLNVKSFGKTRSELMWGQSKILVVTTKEAAAHRQTPAKLAAIWLANIRWLLTMPPLTVTPASVVVPVGETRKVTIGGVAQGPVGLIDERPNISTSTVAPNGRAITIKGLLAGPNCVTITRAGVSVTVNVSVRKYAGRLRIPRSVTVTGSPAPSEMCQQLAKSHAAKSVEAESGARVLVMPPTTDLADIPSGYQSDLTFPVRIEGDGYIPVAGSATVRVVNAALPKTSVANLFYSNSPEQVKKFATLFVGRLDVGQTDRLLYHHQNMMGKAFAFNITLINASSTTARVQIVKAAPDPLVDTVAVGYRAGVQFLPDFMNDIGEVVEIPPMSRMAVCSCALEKIYTASGIMQFRQLEGQPIVLRVAADMVEDGIMEEGAPLAASASDAMLANSPWVYPSPTRVVDAAYTVGKAWAFIRVGKHAIPDATREQQLYGNYGVLYDINVAIDNPSAEQKSVDVLFESAAGLVSGVFLIDGKYVKVTHVAPPREVPLARYILAPNEKRNVSIKTVPLAGSAYPATILVRS